MPGRRYFRLAEISPEARAMEFFEQSVVSAAPRDGRSKTCVEKGEISATGKRILELSFVFQMSQGPVIWRELKKQSQAGLGPAPKLKKAMLLIPLPGVPLSVPLNVLVT